MFRTDEPGTSDFRPLQPATFARSEARYRSSGLPVTVVQKKAAAAKGRNETPALQDWSLPTATYLYRDPSAATLQWETIASYLRDTLGIPCEVRNEFFSLFGGRNREDLARRIAATKVRHIQRPFEVMQSLYGEVQFERRLLEEPSKRVPGILYDGYRYATFLRDLLPPMERNLRLIHIVFAHRLLGTFDEDGRYHARAVVCSVPSVVSTSGIVEGPAKPKEYYIVKAQLSIALGAVPFEAAKQPFAGKFIDYDDSRMTEVAKGYALQAAMYHITHEPFCDDPSCRLFNAHWQSELIAAQVESGRLCARHEATVGEIRRTAGRSRTTRSDRPLRPGR